MFKKFDGSEKVVKLYVPSCSVFTGLVTYILYITLLKTVDCDLLLMAENQIIVCCGQT